MNLILPDEPRAVVGLFPVPAMPVMAPDRDMELPAGEGRHIHYSLRLQGAARGIRQAKRLAALSDEDRRRGSCRFARRRSRAAQTCSEL